jgi:hypothetical protein
MPTTINPTAAWKRVASAVQSGQQQSLRAVRGQLPGQLIGTKSVPYQRASIGPRSTSPLRAPLRSAGASAGANRKAEVRIWPSEIKTRSETAAVVSSHLLAHRHVAQTLACRGKNGVGERGCERW